MKKVSGNQLTNHLASRAYYFKYVTQQAKNNGIIPFFWDNGYTGNEGMGIIDRPTAIVIDRQALAALKEGAETGKYPMTTDN